MTEDECGTMCQRFGFDALVEYDASFKKIDDPGACVDKCKELTPSIFKPVKADGGDNDGAQSLSEKSVKKSKKVMTEDECGTMCQQFGFDALVEYDASFKKIDDPGACDDKCKELTPSIFKPNKADEADNGGAQSLSEKSVEDKKVMTEEECGTMCQRFGFDALVEYDASFKKIDDPGACTDKCKELTPKVFKADAKTGSDDSEAEKDEEGASLLEESEEDEDEEGDSLFEESETESNVLAKLSSEECQTWCQRFGFSMLQQYSADFGHIDDPTACCNKCKELTPTIFTSGESSPELVEVSTKSSSLTPMSFDECGTMCQRFAFSALEPYHADFKKVDDPGACTDKCKQLTPSIFKEDKPE